MKSRNIVSGMQILLSYYSDPDGFHSYVTYDQIWMHATNQPLSFDDLAALISLGWHQEYNGRNYNKSFAPEDYKPAEGWVCYL